MTRKRAFLLGLSLVLLAILWHRTGWRALWTATRELDVGLASLALLLFVPQTWLSGARWGWIVGASQPLTTWQATQQVLASSTLNVLLLSKMGDVAKGAMLARTGLATGLALGVFEKALDTAALAAWMLLATCAAPPDEALGWLLVACGGGGLIVFLLGLARPVATRLVRLAAATRTGWRGRAVRAAGHYGQAVVALRARPGRFALVLASALLLWALHLLQFVLVLAATGRAAPLALTVSRVPMAIFVGLLPVTFAGVGTRDAALVHLLGPTIGAPSAALLGALATLRYVVPALAGVPFVARMRRS